MKVTRIEVERFSAFRKLSLELSSGLNVFIGENATGKTQMMKLMYSLLKALEDVRPNSVLPDLKRRRMAIQDKLVGVFRPENDRLGRLVHRQVGRHRARARLECGQGKSVSFSVSTEGSFRLGSTSAAPTPRAVFIPTHEAMAMFEGFIAAYENRELSFDETYFDLCKALSGTPLRGPRKRAASELLGPLESILEGSVVLRGGRFYVRSKAGRGTLEAHLLAEGHRKIASVAHLIANGSLMRNAVLFWDEPEANLNPRLITKVAAVLRLLASRGVQVFVSTHDYLLSHEIAMAVDYHTKPRVLTRFYAFGRPKPADPVEVQAAEQLSDLEDNAILQEFAAHYDREQRLFLSAPARGGP